MWFCEPDRADCVDEQGAIPVASQRRSASTHTGAAFSLRRSAGIWFCRFVFDKKANRQMLLNGSSEFIGMSVRKVLRSLRFWDSSCTE